MGVILERSRIAEELPTKMAVLFGPLRGGLGISVLSRHTLALDAAMGQLITLDVKHFPIERQWFAVSPTGKQLSIVAQTFLEYLHSTADQVNDIPCHYAEQAGECPLIPAPR